MRTKLIISEKQHNLLTKIIETERYESIVEKIVKELEQNYKKAVQVYRVGNEYKERKVFEIIVDGELIKPKDLLNYLVKKYDDIGEDFLKQLLNDWCDGNIVGNRLTKNVSLSD